MTNLSAWPLSLDFFSRFLLVSALFSLLWEFVAISYLSILLPIANLLLASGETHTHIEIHLNWVLLVFKGIDGDVLHLRFSGHELLYLYPLAAIALITATPHLHTRAKLRWCMGALATFSIFQVTNLYIGTFNALNQYWTQQSTPRQETLAHNGWPIISSANDWHHLFFAFWNTWGGPGLTLVLWIWAAKPYLAESLKKRDT